MTIYYTGKGDKGTSKMGARKMAKSDPLFELLGSLDELNSWLGVCQYKKLKAIQEDLFIAQAEIASIAISKIKSQKSKLQIKTNKLEEEIAKIDKIVPTITKFIIPGASELSAKLDYARTLARRAERSALKTNEANKATSSAELIQYLNRLSSYLFALARLVNFRLKLKEHNPSYK